jgi:hypothetical protein
MQYLLTLFHQVKLQSGNGQVYSGVVHACQSTYQEYGVLGFYKGVASPFLGYTVFNATLFFAYGTATRFVRGNLPASERVS